MSASVSRRASDVRKGGIRLESLDQAGVDQESIETPRLRAAVASVEQPVAALQDALLLGKGRIERQAGRLLQHQWQIRPFDGVKRGRNVGGLIVHRVDGVIGGE